jgi:hypothetical protein
MNIDLTSIPFSQTIRLGTNRQSINDIEPTNQLLETSMISVVESTGMLGTNFETNISSEMMRIGNNGSGPDLLKSQGLFGDQRDHFQDYLNQNFP